MVPCTLVEDAMPINYHLKSELTITLLCKLFSICYTAVQVKKLLCNCNQGTIMKKMWMIFHYTCKGNHHMQPPNRPFCHQQTWMEHKVGHWYSGSSLIWTPIVRTPANLNNKSECSIGVFCEQVYVLLEYLNWALCIINGITNPNKFTNLKRLLVKLRTELFRLVRFHCTEVCLSEGISQLLS